VGCGDGLFFEKLQRFGPVEGVEMDPTGVAPDGPWIDRIHVRPFDETFQPGKRYALVLMLDVLEHFADPVRALRRAVELLGDGGAILITVPAFRALWTSHDVLNRHYTRYTRASLEAVAAQSGARLEWSRYVFRWMSPLKLAASLKERILPVAPEPPRIPPAWVNRALYRLSRIEDRLIGRAPIPFGSSLFAVARRA
jgi:SAM-dependent methyltransferase